MLNLYCQSCGTKSNASARFCSSCGTSIGNKLSQAIEPEKKTKANIEVDDEGIPTEFEKPTKLHYSIDIPNTKSTFADIVNGPIGTPYQERRIEGYVKPTKEQLESELIKKFASKKSFQEIDGE